MTQLKCKLHTPKADIKHDTDGKGGRKRKIGFCNNGYSIYLTMTKRKRYILKIYKGGIQVGRDLLEMKGNPGSLKWGDKSHAESVKTSAAGHKYFALKTVEDTHINLRRPAVFGRIAEGIVMADLSYANITLKV